jgi:acetyltransferase-like isoleucine patch superfamily enzyme
VVFFRGLYNLCLILFVLGKFVVLMARYNERTIAQYFRKQGAKIGENCVISVLSLGREPYLVSIGNHVDIARGATFHTHDGAAWICSEEIPDIDIFGPITIEDNCLIGGNSHILPNVRIGKNSIVAAGSVVISDVPPDSIVMGVPARVIGSSLKYREKCVAKWKQQKPPDYKKIEKGRLLWRISKGHKENENKLKRHLSGIFNLFEDYLPHDRRL